VAHLLSNEDIWWQLGWSIRYEDQGIGANGGTLDTNSRHLSMPRHSGWEPLLYRVTLIEDNTFIKKGDNLNVR